MNKIVIDGEISRWGYGARWFKNELSSRTGELEVEISSYGGDVFEGIEMFNDMRQYSKEKGRITTVNKSKAMSIASLLFLGGDTKKAYTNSTIMIHKAWTWLAGNSDDLTKEAKVLDSIDNILATTYLKYMKTSNEDIKQIMKDEGWYIGKEQMETTGFVDEFIDAEDQPEDLAMAKKAFANSIDKFKEYANENDTKPNFEAVAQVITKIQALATMPSDNEKIVNSKIGANMEFNEDNFNMLIEENKILKAHKDTLNSRADRLNTQLETIQAALDTTKEENVELKASLTSKLSDAETAVREALSMNITDVTTVVKMMNATPEEASRIAISAKEDSSINAGDSFQQEKKDAWADFI